MKLKDDLPILFRVFVNAEHFIVKKKVAFLDRITKG